MLGLAGCVTDRTENEVEGGNDEPGDTDEEDPEDGDEEDMDETKENESTDGEVPEGVTEVSFEVLDVRSGTSENSASVTFESERVLISGTIMGRNTCYTAKITDVSLSEGGLVVAIESYENADEDEMCAQSIVGIDYEASIEFDDNGPETVVVEHDGSAVTTDER